MEAYSPATNSWVSGGADEAWGGFLDFLQFVNDLRDVADVMHNTLPQGKRPLPWVAKADDVRRQTNTEPLPKTYSIKYGNHLLDKQGRQYWYRRFSDGHDSSFELPPGQAPNDSGGLYEPTDIQH